MAITKMGFFEMLGYGYSAVGTGLRAVARGANALDKMGIWAEDAAEAMVNEAREDRVDAATERQIARQKRQAAAQAELAALNAPATVQTTQQTLLN